MNNTTLQIEKYILYPLKITKSSTIKLFFKKHLINANLSQTHTFANLNRKKFLIFIFNIAIPKNNHQQRFRIDLKLDKTRIE